MPKTQVMIVEDEIIVGRDIKNMLLGLGYAVPAVVTDHLKAIEKAKQTNPDMILMDIMLEGKARGIELADEIYNDLHIPVVYLTAYTDEITLEKAKKTAPFGYLLKPFEEKELQTMIEIALFKFEMEQQLKERERWLSAILENIGDGVIAMDKNGVISFMNPLAEKLTGWEQSEALQKPFQGILHIYKYKAGKRQPIKFHKIRSSSEHHEAVCVSKTSEETPVIWRISSIADERKNMIGAVFSLTDITTLIKAEEQLKKSLKKLKEAMDATIQAIANIIESRDPYTAGHQKQVSKLACAIAEEMRFPEDQIEGLRAAAGIHDIGKISVPAEILNKPGQISSTEFELIKIHSQAGYDILKPIEFPWPVAQIVLQHHERLDGSGYPSGLKKNGILIEAQILAVADVVEAMGTHRPYRPALTLGEALEEISKNKGKLYNSRAASACIKLFKEGFRFEEKA